MDKFRKSNELLDRAKKVTPLGAQTYSKSYRYYCGGNAPSFIDKGEGCRLFDVDGNEFIDFVCALGAVTVGYNNQRINCAIARQLEKGVSFSLQTDVEVLLAEKMTRIIPSAEMVRFVKNGSDATSAAIRLARAYTGKEMVAVSGYHGMHDWYIASTENNRGVPAPVRELTKSFTYNDLQSLEELFELFPDKFAAVILEPIQGDGPSDGYLQKLERLIHKNGALLIFDEVVSGFRYALGGASELYGITPDLATYGKGMGNGMPISAIVGRADIMKLIGEGVFVSTTFGGEALSLAAALETINILKEPGSFQHIWSLGEMMQDGLKKLVNELELTHIIKISGLPPHCGPIFEGFGSFDYLDFSSVFSQSMIDNGILSIGVNNINLSHSEEEINLYLKAAEEGMLNINKVLNGEDINTILKYGKVDPIFKRNIK